MWQALSEGRSLHVHHVHLKNSEGRLHYEADAVKRILEWMKGQGLVNFRYTESRFDYGNLGFLVKDHCIWAFMIGVIMTDPQNKDMTRVIRPDHYDSLPEGPDGPGMQRAHDVYRSISEKVCQRSLIFEHPIQHLTKAEVIKAMPKDLLECCWWCRHPTSQGDTCHKCYTCQLVDPALDGRSKPKESKKVML